MTNTDLAERIERLNGPCREMDAEIAVLALGMERDGDYFFGKDEDFVLERDYYSLDGTARELPHYTSSLDAAMTLVPEGMMFTVSLHDHGQGAASIFKRDANGSRETACKLCVASTPALALCAAALRANHTNGASE